MKEQDQIFPSPCQISKTVRVKSAHWGQLTFGQVKIVPSGTTSVNGGLCNPIGFKWILIPNPQTVEAESPPPRIRRISVSFSSLWYSSFRFLVPLNQPGSWFISLSCSGHPIANHVDPDMITIFFPEASHGLLQKAWLSPWLSWLLLILLIKLLPQRVLQGIKYRQFSP